MESEKLDIIKEVVRFLTSEESQGTNGAIDTWLKEDERHQVIFDEIRDIWFSLNASEESKRFEVEKAWDKYSRWIDQEQTKEKPKGIKRFLLISSRYAAIFAVVALGVALVFNYLIGNNENVGFVADMPLGQTGTITLYDGTQVTIKGGSRLECYSFGNNKERRVKLDGEAYFEVAHNPQLPFYVDVNNLSVKVYGTEFNVYGYEADDFTETTLYNGKVGILLSNGDEHVLNPSDIIRVSKNDEVEFIKGQASELDAQRILFTYKFKNEDLSNVAKRIERMYGVKVILEDEALGKEKYTGSMKENEHLDNVIQRLEMTSPYQIDFHIKENEIIIKKK